MYEDAALAVLGAVPIVAASRPTVVGIAGPPGSGKTTLARAITAAARDAVAVPMDGFHLSNRQLARQGLADVKGSPPTFDRAGLIAALRRLGSGDPVYFPDFDHALHEPVAAAIRVDPETPLVVVEGNYLLLDRSGWRDVSGLLDLRVFLEVPWPMCRERLIARHIQAGKSPAEAEAWVDRSDHANYELIRAARVTPDVLIRQDIQGSRVSLNA
ncbi:MAG TPA: nucleoside triphosphate hydrolase [Candidatus Nanopelagicales bacterium]|nr:nucleoside triphosphate hydrolase [Candidatus Nanopelagicales bacterium]